MYKMVEIWRKDLSFHITALRNTNFVVKENLILNPKVNNICHVKVVVLIARIRIDVSTELKKTEVVTTEGNKGVLDYEVFNLSLVRIFHTIFPYLIVPI